MRAHCVSVVGDEATRQAGYKGRHAGRHTATSQPLKATQKLQTHDNAHKPDQHRGGTHIHTHGAPNTLHSQVKSNVCSCVNMAREGANALAPSAPILLPEHTPTTQQHKMKQQHIKGAMTQPGHTTHKWRPSRMRAQCVSVVVDEGRGHTGYKGRHAGSHTATSQPLKATQSLQTHDNAHTNQTRTREAHTHAHTVRQTHSTHPPNTMSAAASTWPERAPMP